MEAVQGFPHKSILSLPTEILCHIFSFVDDPQALATLHAVCKLFREILEGASFRFSDKMFDPSPASIFYEENLSNAVSSPYIYIEGNKFYIISNRRVGSCWSWNGHNDCTQEDTWKLPPLPPHMKAVFSNFTEKGSIASLTAAHDYFKLHFIKDEVGSINIFEKGNENSIHHFSADIDPHFKQNSLLTLQENFLAVNCRSFVSDKLTVFSLPEKKILHTMSFEEQHISRICSDSRLIAVYLEKRETNGKKTGQEIKIIDVISGELKHHSISFNITSLSSQYNFYLDDGKIIALTTEGELKSIDVDTLEERTFSRLTFDVSSQSFRKTLIAISNHKAALFTKKNTFIELYDLKKWECLTCFPVPSSIGKINSIVLHKHFLAAAGQTKELSYNDTSIFNNVTIVWHPFLPKQEEKDDLPHRFGQVKSSRCCIF
jgi:hypothetical protein